MHTIRLREPWQVESLPGRSIYRRHFNCPTGLAVGDRVILAIDELANGASTRLNGQPLSDGAPRWDIAALLQPRNEIAIEVSQAAPSDSRPFGEVRLEIGAT